MKRATFANIGKAGAARAALAVALSTGLAAGGLAVSAVPAMAKDKKEESKSPKISAGFRKIAAPLSAALGKAKDKPEVKAAGDDPAKLGAALADEKAMVNQAFTAATSPDDQFVAGQFAVNLGGLAKDPALQRKGLKAMLESGFTPAAEVPKYSYFVGSLAFQAKDYAEAEQYLQKAIDGGYTDSNAGALLAEAYFADNKTQQGLDALKTSIDAHAAAGKPAPAAWYSRGISMAYTAKLGPQAVDWSQMMVKAYPSAINWLNAGQVTREFASPEFTSQESLDLGRLLLRTGALKNDPKYTEREYVEYVQAADPRRLPGEVVKVINDGIANGALPANDTFVADSLKEAKGRIPADKASLPGLEKDARSAANGVTAMAAGDAYLSYDMPAKAADMYQLALTKGGVETERVETRLGIAQVDEGKYDDAKATFAKITGPRKTLAALWTIYANQKASGGAAPAAEAATPAS
ncbi:hypothetical protein RXV95_07555 [Novosphingobium sp. ZN18A2]|uniref:hypothetical protein n=1 Tax=Novosphingobium sp. ZN18A2 TaxID=3079861 RepID=UPI0030CA9FD9